MAKWDSSPKCKIGLKLKNHVTDYINGIKEKNQMIDMQKTIQKKLLINYKIFKIETQNRSKRELLQSDKGQL